jgi:hypothetical protein
LLRLRSYSFTAFAKHRTKNILACKHPPVAVAEETVMIEREKLPKGIYMNTIVCTLEQEIDVIARGVLRSSGLKGGCTDARDYF